MYVQRLLMHRILASPVIADARSVSVAAGPEIEVEVPPDSRVRFIIDSMAAYVVADGCAFEQAVMTAHAANPEFAFLFDLRCLEHAYYRWRLYSLASGDSLKSWRVEPFVMVEGGPRCRSSLSGAAPCIESKSHNKISGSIAGNEYQMPRLPNELVCWCQEG